MKKVVLSLALVAMMSVSFVSCKETKAEEPAATEEVVTEEAPVVEETPAAADTTNVEAVEAATPAAAPAH